METMMEEVAVARRRCERVVDRIERLPRLNDSCRRTLLKRAFSELNFLSGSPHPTPLSVNVGHLEAVLHLLEQPFVTGVSRVCKQIPLSKACDSSSKGVHVDVVCTLNKKPVWILVSDRNPKYVFWNGCNRKSKGLKERIKEVLAGARCSQVTKPSSVILFFSHGLVDSVFEKLRDEFGASDFGLEFDSFDCDFFEELEGDWVNVLARSYKGAHLLEIKVDCRNAGVPGSECGIRDLVLDSAELGIQEEHGKSNLDDAFCALVLRMKSWTSGVESVPSVKPEELGRDDDIVNFSTTALIALVSGISNGCTEKLLASPEVELRQKFKGNLEFVIGQVMSEVQNPMLVELGNVISGKRGILCETVLLELKELITLYGGPKEKFRASKLLKRIMVVADSPSERMMSLPTTRNLALKNKIVFGTGDRWRAVTLTANMAFVRAVSQTGMSLATIEHRPRALVGD